MSALSINPPGNKSSRAGIVKSTTRADAAERTPLQRKKRSTILTSGLGDPNDPLLTRPRLGSGILSG